MTENTVPPLEGLLETALYVRDLPESVRFYRDLFGFEVLLDAAPRLIALGVADRQVLLLFQQGCTEEPVDLPGGRVPGHGAAGVQHLAFAITPEALQPWRERLRQAGIPVESEVTWEPGGVSVYFRDPDHHSVELLTPGFWRVY